MLGPHYCQALVPLGIGRKSAWKPWAAFPEVTSTFIIITQDPASLTLDSLHMQRLERSTVLVCSNVNLRTDLPTVSSHC